MHRHYSDTSTYLPRRPSRLGPGRMGPTPRSGMALVSTPLPGMGDHRGTMSLPTSPLGRHGGVAPWDEIPQTAQAFFALPPTSQDLQLQQPQFLSQHSNPSSSSDSISMQIDQIHQSHHQQQQQIDEGMYHLNGGDGDEEDGMDLDYSQHSPFGELAPVGGSGRQRKKRAQVRVACTHCQKACKKCSNTRPCERCLKYGLTDCVDSTRKPRKTGIKRGPYKRRNSKYLQSPTSSTSSRTFQPPPPMTHSPQPPSFSTPTFGQTHTPSSGFGNYQSTRWVNGQRLPLSPENNNEHLAAHTQPYPSWGNHGHGQNRPGTSLPNNQISPSFETIRPTINFPLNSGSNTQFPLSLNSTDDPFSRAVSPIHQGSYGFLTKKTSNVFDSGIFGGRTGAGAGKGMGGTDKSGQVIIPNNEQRVEDGDIKLISTFQSTPSSPMVQVLTPQLPGPRPNQNSNPGFGGNNMNNQGVQPHQIFSAPSSPHQNSGTNTPGDGEWEVLRQSLQRSLSQTPAGQHQNQTINNQTLFSPLSFNTNPTANGNTINSGLGKGTANIGGMNIHSPMIGLNKIRKPSLRTLIISSTNGPNSSTTSRAGSPIPAPSPTLFDQPMSLDEGGGVDLDLGIGLGLSKVTSGSGGLKDEIGSAEEVKGLNDVWGGLLGDSLGTSANDTGGNGEGDDERSGGGGEGMDVERGSALGLMGFDNVLPFGS